MDYVDIGDGIRASRVGLGTWAIGGWLWGGTDEVDSVRTIRTALELGINLIDTAPVYGFGKSEELVGKAIAGHEREDIIIATKAGLEWASDGSIRRNSKPERIREEVEASLKRLGTDYIDIYQIHWPDESTPFIETAEVMDELVEEEVVRAVGVSNFMPEQMELFMQGCRLASNQPPYNLFERGIEADVLPFCRENGIATIGYGALCRGLLSGRMTADREFEGDDIRKWDPKFKDPAFTQHLEAARKLDDWAADIHGKTVIELAVRWILDRGVEVALWGARRPDQLDDLEGVFDWVLQEADKEEIEDILAQTIMEPVGPEFMRPG